MQARDKDVSLFEKVRRLNFGHDEVLELDAGSDMMQFRGYKAADLLSVSDASQLWESKTGEAFDSADGSRVIVHRDGARPLAAGTA